MPLLASLTQHTHTTHTHTYIHAHPHKTRQPGSNVFRGRDREDLRGFPFCDDDGGGGAGGGNGGDGGDTRSAAAAELRALRLLRPRWERAAAAAAAAAAGAGASRRHGRASTRHRQQLIEAGVAASTTDDATQAPQQVVANDRGFWSSTGAAGRGADGGGEWLLLRLAGPAARVTAVRVAVYRALYQAGHPVYPPQAVQVWLGGSPARMARASPWMAVLPTDAAQTFPVFADAPPAR